MFGDTHGDWRSTEEVVKRYRADGRCLVGLGDYVDRAPDDCGAGSVANALYLLSLAAEAPDRVYLIQGNHEVVRRIPAIPHNLPEEVDELWGPDSTRYERILGLFERGPLAMTTSNGAYLAHAGFPRGVLPSPWTKAFESMDTERLAEITWAECDAVANPPGRRSPVGESRPRPVLAGDRPSVDVTRTRPRPDRETPLRRTLPHAPYVPNLRTVRGRDRCASSSRCSPTIRERPAGRTPPDGRTVVSFPVVNRESRADWDSRLLLRQVAFTWSVRTNSFGIAQNRVLGTVVGRMGVSEPPGHRRASSPRVRSSNSPRPSFDSSTERKRRSGPDSRN